MSAFSMEYPLVIDLYETTNLNQYRQWRKSSCKSDKMREVEHKTQQQQTQTQLDQPKDPSSTPPRPSTPQNKPHISSAGNTPPSALRPASGSPSSSCSKKSVRFAADTKTTIGNIGARTVKRYPRVALPAATSKSNKAATPTVDMRANAAAITPKSHDAERNLTNNTSAYLTITTADPLIVPVTNTPDPPINMQSGTQEPSASASASAPAHGTDGPNNAPTHSYWSRFSRKVLTMVTKSSCRLGNGDKAAHKKAKKLQKQQDKERAQRAESLRRLSRSGWDVRDCNSVKPEYGTLRL